MPREEPASEFALSDDFSVFFAAEYRSVAGLASVLSGHRSVGEELAQEAFVSAFRRWDVVGGYEDPGGWVRRVIANRSVSWYRKRVAETRALFKIAAGARTVLPALEAESEEVWAAVRRLSGRQGQVIALMYLEDMSLEEIAELLDIAVPTVGTHLQRGRKALAGLLATAEEATSP